MKLRDILTANLIIFACLPIVSPAAVYAQQPMRGFEGYQRAEEEVPLIVLIETDPWAMVLGVDGPTFVLYESGLVIFRRMQDERRYELVSAILKPSERDALLKKLNLNDSFFALKEFYDASDWTDQPTNMIYTWDAKHGQRWVSVYGRLRNVDDARKKSPAAFLSVFDQLIAFDHPQATKWLPEMFEVFVWSYDTEDAANWPAKLPDLTHPTTVKRGEGFSIYLTPEQMITLAEVAWGKSAVRINGKTWAFSAIVLFPGQDMWNRKPEKPQS